VDERDRETREYTVIAFSSDPAHWYYQSPRLRMTRPGLDGAYRITGLPPGEYVVIAVDGITGEAGTGEWPSPAVIGSLPSGGQRVRVGERQEVTATLRRMIVAGR
jgi:hypothetical protein